MTQAEIDILKRIESLAEKKIDLMDDDLKRGYLKDYNDLQAIRSWVHFAIKYDGIDQHQDGVAGCLKNIAAVVKRWGWDLSGG